MIISIHAPRGGSDAVMGRSRVITGNFNPRSPWGERQLVVSLEHQILLFQSTLPVGGATKAIFLTLTYNDISIHAPRGGSDVTCTQDLSTGSVFQSTLPVGGATQPYKWVLRPNGHFNPRSPWGERPTLVVDDVQRFIFQSTLPVGGATTRVSWR